MSDELNWWGLGLSLMGLGWLIWKSQWPKLLLTGTAFLTYLIFNLFYTVSDIEVFFIPNFLLLALWAGLAMGAILAWIGQRAGFIAIVLAGATLAFMLTQQGGQSRADDWAIHDYALDALAQPAPGGAVVGIQGEMTLLRYFQETRGLRPDLRTYRADGEAERLAQVETLLAEDPARPVYLTRELPGLPEQYSLSAVGPLIRVNPEAITALPAINHTSNTPLSRQINLTGYSIDLLPSNRTPLPVRLTLVWQAQQPITVSLKVSARLLNQAGELVAVVDKTPVHFAYPTSSWRPGEFISDVYDLRLPSDAPPGDYTPLVILYNPANNAAEVGRVTLPPVKIVKSLY